MYKSKWKPKDWHCNKCDFKIFGSKDKCFKCGLKRNQSCCKKCKYVSDEYISKCPKCNTFSSLLGEYYWRKENNEGLEEFITKNPSYRPYHCRICDGQGPLRSCWNH